MTDIRFEDALQRLELLVDQLEAGNLALEESLKVFEEGVGLARRCAKYSNTSITRCADLTEADMAGLSVRRVHRRRFVLFTYVNSFSHM